MPTKKLKVLHVIPSVSDLRGGPSKAVIEMVCALRLSGVDAEIATTNDNGADTLDVSLNELISYREVPIRFFKRSSPPISAAREFAYSNSFRRWIKANIKEYDLIHVHAIFSFCSSYAMKSARENQVAYVVRPIGQLEKWSLEQSQGRKKIYLDLIEQKNLESADGIQFTAHSEQTQALEALPNLRGNVIPLGLGLPLEIGQATHKMLAHWNLTRGIPTICYVSRLHPKKGLELLLSALSTLQHRGFQLVIAGLGEDNYTKELQTLVEDLGLRQQVKFIGFIQGTEKNLLLQGSDLFALTSHSENFGISVLEAMSSGTAVLISRQVALSEQVQAHKLGFVAELNEADIRNQLNQALSNLDSTQEIGRNARDYVEQHFQWHTIAKQLKAWYTKLYNK